MSAATLILVRLQCCTCDVLFGMTHHVYDTRKKDGRAFYCTNGHAQVFNEATEVTLRRRLAAVDALLAAERIRRLSAERKAAAQKGNVTKLKTKLTKECK